MHHPWYAWIVIGFVAGALASRVTRVEVGGCFLTTLVGIAGGLVGGAVVDSRNGDTPAYGVLASILIAFVFTAIFLAVLRALGIGRPTLADRIVGRRRGWW